MDKKNLTESDIRARFITPAIEQAGWDPMTQVFHEFGLRAGRISVRGRIAQRDKSSILKADYALFFKPNIPIAAVEAKDNKHVGEVTEPMQSVKDFMVPTQDGNRPALQVLEGGKAYAQNADDPEKAEYFVRVKWLETVDAANAFNEVGLFGNQNTVCQPRTPKWRHTVERLKTVFKGWEG